MVGASRRLTGAFKVIDAHEPPRHLLRLNMRLSIGLSFHADAHFVERRIFMRIYII